MVKLLGMIGYWGTKSCMIGCLHHQNFWLVCFCCFEPSSFFSSDTGVYFSAERVEAHLPADSKCTLKGVLKPIWRKKIFAVRVFVKEVGQRLLGSNMLLWSS
jgi:hypothetical protein